MRAPDADIGGVFLFSCSLSCAYPSLAVQRLVEVANDSDEQAHDGSELEEGQGSAAAAAVLLLLALESIDERYELLAGMDIALAVNTFDMAVYRAFSNKEAFGDFFGRLVARGQP